MYLRWGGWEVLWQRTIVIAHKLIDIPVFRENLSTKASGKLAASWPLLSYKHTHKYVTDNKNKGKVEFFLQMTPLATVFEPLKIGQTLVEEASFQVQLQCLPVKFTGKTLLL